MLPAVLLLVAGLVAGLAGYRWFLDRRQDETLRYLSARLRPAEPRTSAVRLIANATEPASLGGEGRLGTRLTISPKAGARDTE